MSYNGSGTFNINTAGQPVVDGTVISSSVFNALTADLGTGLTTAITKDGQTTPTANIPLGTFKITGLGAGTAATDAVRMSQLQAGGTTFLTAAGTDTITATASPSLTAYATGNLFTFVVAVTNTGAVTLNIDGLGAKAVTRDGTTALAANDLVATEVVIVGYDGTQFQVLNPNAATNYRVSGTLGVTGAATLSSTLAVSGNTTLASGSAGAVIVGGGATASELRLLEPSGSGTNYSSFQSPAMAGNVTYTLPIADGTSGFGLTTNGSGVLSWASAGGTTIPSGTVMLFAQTTAPTGFTKNTASGDNHALRVVTGSASTGGTVDFTTAFASQAVSGSVSVSAISGSAGAMTLSTPQIPSHSHTVIGSAVLSGESPGAYAPQATPGASSGTTGGGGSHDHPFSFSSATASFSGTAINLAVKYVDVIRATKD